MFNTTVVKKYEIEVGSGFFPEVWTADVVLKWGSDSIEIGDEYKFDHVEFKCKGGTIISETGYRSEFLKLGEDIGESVKSLAQYLAKCQVKNFKEVIC